ncbi:MAG: hypothetical protein K8T90_22290 [Planctomycetes bacterium]|nr:hypothetical protein [Planctomycetota bacterium]
MKKILALALIVVASAAYTASHTSAFAGGCCGGGGGGGGGGAAAKGDDFPASNQCPLAQAANKCRSTGREAGACSTAVQATMAACVQRNLAKI